MPAQLSIGARGADADSIRKNFDLPNLWNIPDIDQFSVGQFSSRVQNHHIGTAGNGQPLSRLAGQQGKNRVQIARRNESVFGWIGSHSATLRRAVLATDSNICM